MTTEARDEFKGLGVFLTGATSGIGHEAASRFLAAGATVACVGRRTTELAPLVGEFGPRCVPLVADLADAGAVGAVAAEAMRAPGQGRRAGQRRRGRLPGGRP